MKNKKYKYINYILILFLAIFSFKTIAYALDCNSWGILRDDIRTVFHYIKIIIPLIIVGISAFEFIKAVGSKDEKDLKKAVENVIKRMIWAVVIFLLPTLIETLLGLLEVDSSICL